jgi:hypothetical protein
MANASEQMRARATSGLVRGLLVSAILAIVTFVHDAAADPKRAEESFTTGLRSFDAADYGQAADYFARAYSDEPRSKYLWNLAIAEQKAGRSLAALKHLRLYKAAADAARAHLAVVDDLIDRALARVGQIIVEAPEGFAVMMDGTAIGVAPLSEPIDVEPDVEHDVHADAGDSHLRARVVVPAAETRTAKLEQEPTQPSTSEAIALPRNSRGTESPPPAAVAPHSHQARNILVIAVGALALAAEGVGAVYLARAAHDRSSSDEYNVAVDSFIVAGGLGAAAVGAFVLWPKGSAERRTWLGPEVGPGTAGIRLGGRF